MAMEKRILGMSGRLVRVLKPTDHPACREGALVLAVVSRRTVQDTVEAVFAEAGWSVRIADTIDDAVIVDRHQPVPIILLDRDLPGHYWKDDVVRLIRLKPRPCVILLSDHADKNLWDEHLRLGGFAVLRTPLQCEALVRAIQSGLGVWQGQQRLRQLPPRRRPSLRRILRASAHIGCRFLS